MKQFHMPRKLKGRNDHLNAEVKQIEGDDGDFLQFAWLAFGLKPDEYPEKVDPRSWATLYQRYPGVDPGNQYWGDF